MTLEGIVGSLDGTVVFRENVSRGNSEEADALGTKLADSLIAMGATGIFGRGREQAAANSHVTM